jgi:hypothetical protein
MTTLPKSTPNESCTPYCPDNKRPYFPLYFVKELLEIIEKRSTEFNKSINQ